MLLVHDPKASWDGMVDSRAEAVAGTLTFNIYIGSDKGRILLAKDIPPANLEDLVKQYMWLEGCPGNGSIAIWPRIED